MRPAKAGVLLISLSLAGCAGKSIPAIGTSVLDGLPKVENSRLSPCWQQKQIAAQRSYVDTVKSGKQQVYKADCKDSPRAPDKSTT